VSLDPRYLNAWKKLDGVARHTYLESGERDIARLKLLELDPLQRHTYPDLDEVGDLRGLWLAADKAQALRRRAAAPAEGAWRLEASAKRREEADQGVPPEMRLWRDFDGRRSLEPYRVMNENVLIASAAQLATESYGSEGDAVDSPRGSMAVASSR
jgi:hypothetical protein